MPKSQVGAGCGLGHEGHRIHPADILVPNWESGQLGAIDLIITSPLNSFVLSEASVRAGSAVQAAERRKHQASNENDKNLDGYAFHCN